MGLGLRGSLLSAGFRNSMCSMRRGFGAIRREGERERED